MSKAVESLSPSAQRVYQALQAERERNTAVTVTKLMLRLHMGRPAVQKALGELFMADLLDVRGSGR